MALSEIRSNPSWQQAIELGPRIVRLAEELPASEQLGLTWQLQQAMVELPAAIAADLMTEGSNTRHAAALKLITALELVEKVYPALDTMRLRQDSQELVERIASDDFGMQAGGPTAPQIAAPAMEPPAAQSAPVAPTAPVASSAPAEEPAAPAPHTVQVVPDASPAPEHDV